MPRKKNKIDISAFSGRARKCDVCKKEFIWHDDWAYKMTSGYKVRMFCSWHCLRDYQRRHESNKQTGKDIYKAIQDGLNDKEIAELLNVDHSRIAYWRDKHKKELAAKMEEEKP